MPTNQSNGNITLPYKYTPRKYQASLFNCINDGYRRACVVWHRRSGKGKTLLNLIVKEAWNRIGAYYYFYPTYNQGRKALWDGIGKDGIKYLDHIPEEIRESTNNTEMKIKLINGSLVQIIGSDNVKDTIVSTNPIGNVFDEFSVENPIGWEFIRPIVTENEGWAIFAGTPRGFNHFHKLYEIAKKQPDIWFSEILTVDDTGVITKEQIAQEVRDGMDEDLAQQEFYCSWQASIAGAYYSKEMSLALTEKRIRVVPIEPGLQVQTFWDLGIDDSTSIWMAQNVGREIHLVGYYTNSGEGLIHYVNYLKDWRDRRRVTFGKHVLPHDGANRSLQTGKTTVEYLKELGLCDIDVIQRPKLKESAIEAVRQTIGRCWFDDEGCKQGIEGMRQFRKEYSEVNQVFKARPVHDIHSHCADAFQTLALWHQVKNVGINKEPKIRTRYRPSYEISSGQGWMR